MRENIEDHFVKEMHEHEEGSISQETFNEDVLFLLEKSHTLSVRFFDNRITLFEEMKVLDHPLDFHRHLYRRNSPFNGFLEYYEHNPSKKEYAAVLLKSDLLNKGMTYPELISKLLKGAFSHADIFYRITRDSKKLALLVKVFPKMRTTFGELIISLINQDIPFNTPILSKVVDIVAIKQMLPEYFERLFTTMLKKKQWFHYVMRKVDDVIECSKKDKNWGDQVANYILNDQDEVERLMTSTDQVRAFANQFPEYKKILFDRINSKLKLAQIVRENRDLINISNSFPDQSVYIMQTILADPCILKNVIRTTREFINTLKFLNSQIHGEMYKEATEESIYQLKQSLVSFVLRDTTNFKLWVEDKHDVNKLAEYFYFNPQGLPKRSIELLKKASTMETFEEVLRLIEREENKDIMVSTALACNTLKDKVGEGGVTQITAMTGNPRVDYNTAYIDAGWTVRLISLFKKKNQPNNILPLEEVTTPAAQFKSK
ncbi:MAG: hypothetical protein H2069_09480 [Legionella sp.]|nr:hypothetical protein [Legionella sp.]